MESSSKVICLLGMHRSGTSLVANWLHKSGLTLGNNLLKEDYSNVAGHFEDIDFLSLHKDILHFNHLEISGLNLNDSQLKLSDYHEAKIRHTIALKNELYSQWGWKEPRTCLVINQYQKEITDLKVLIVYRPAIEVIQSLLKRDWKRWKKNVRRQTFLRFNAKLLFKPFFKRKLVKEKLPTYIKSCELYFEALINTIKKSSSENVITFSLDYFLKHDKIVFDTLTKKWNFNLNYYPTSQLFNAELMGNDLDFKIELPASLINMDNQLSQLIQP